MHGCDLSHLSFLLLHSRHDVIIRFRLLTRGTAAAGAVEGPLDELDAVAGGLSGLMGDLS